MTLDYTAPREDRNSSWDTLNPIYCDINMKYQIGDRAPDPLWK